MPGGDGTGPRGMGPMTGRAAGYCAGYPAPGSASPIPGRGFGMGYGAGYGRGRGGGGRGRRNWYRATGVPGWARFGYAPAWGQPPAFAPYAAPNAPQVGGEQEVEWLNRQAEWLKEQLDGITQRIDELQAEDT